MDIQNEKEAFEKHASKFFITNEAFEDDGENYVYDEVKFMWDCWLAAKAQAVPEGFVLMPKEIGNFDSPIANALEKGIVRDWPASEIYAAMIEAQEPAND